MTNKASKYAPVVIIALIIAVIAGIQYFKNSSPVTQENPNKPGSENSQETSDANPQAEEGQLSGTLKISDNLKRGNLMLVTKDRVIYLFTSRDYSALVNKEVKIKINGTLENFRLIDILPK